MSTEVDRILLARDVYKRWKRRVQRAEESIRVFTPYFDSSLSRLLSNSPLEPTELSLVTDLSPVTGALDYRGQLIGARALLRRGVEVRSLPRLHAKVLLCDGTQVTIGSQNFTRYGRNSKETTAVVEDDVSDSLFVSTLDQWYAESTPVTLEFIEALLAELADPLEVLKEAQTALNKAFDERWEAYLARLEAERRAREEAAQRKSLALQLARAVRDSTTRQARQSVWARLQTTGEVDFYDSLITDKTSTLTSWRTRRSDGATSLETLTRLNFYPMILNPSGRMGFGRIAKTRITYVRSSVSFNRPREILGSHYKLTLRFPSHGLDAVNIEMTLSISGRPEYVALDLGLRFDGLETRLQRWNVRQTTLVGSYAARSVEIQTDQLQELSSLLHDPATLTRLLSTAFGTFTFSELGIGNRNATEFFPQGWVRVTIIDYADQPVLVVTPYTG